MNLGTFTAGAVFSFLAFMMVGGLLIAEAKDSRRTALIAAAPMLIVGMCLGGLSSNFAEPDALLGVVTTLILMPVCVFTTEIARRFVSGA